MNGTKDLETALLDRLCYVLVEQGVEDIQVIRNKFLLILQGFDIEPKEEALVVYTEGKNEILLKRFLMSKVIAGCSSRTIQYYGSECRKILEIIGKDADTITSEDIQGYIARRMAQGVSNVTINSERRAFSSFTAWMTEHDILSKNPMLKVEKLKEPKVKKEAFTEIEVEKLRNACESGMEKAIIDLLMSTGCRVSEIAAIEIEKIEGDRIYVLGKGNKYRYVYLNAAAQLSIEKYLSERSDSNPYLFPKGISIREMQGNGKGLKDWYKNPKFIADGYREICSIENTVRNIGRRADVKKVHPHKFRRTCATFALKRGMPIEMVSKMLGHANIATTQIYLDLGDEELSAQHKKFVT